MRERKMIHTTSKHILVVLLTLVILSTTLFPISMNKIYASTTAGMTELVSLSSDGHQGDSASYNPTISSDGNIVAFESEASNLVSNDTNEAVDIFVHNIQTGITERVSLSSDGTQGNDFSVDPSLSGDGRYVAFKSGASNLVANDMNNSYDVFVHDRELGVTQRVSISSNGTEGNNYSHFPSISSDGRFVAFYSGADNLVPNDTNDASDIFIHDRETGLTEIVSLSTSGTQGNNSSWSPSISFDGRYVTFDSWATNLVANDTNDEPDVFVHDRQTGQTERVSVSNDGTQGNKTSEDASISGDGNYVVFRSRADNLVSDDTNNTTDIFVHNRETGQTERVSVASNGTEGVGYVFYSSISENGRFVAFDSEASELVANDTNGSLDIFIHDRQTGQTERVSVSTNGTQGNNESWSPSISASGQYVAFDSYSGNLVDSDTNGTYDVFVHDRCPDGSCVDGDFDFTIEDVIPMQVIEDLPLVLGKSTAVKVVIHKTGPGSADSVSVCLNVSGKLLNKFYVDDNNRNLYNSLQHDNIQHPLNFGSGEQRKVIYFFSDELTPTGKNFSVTAKIDCSGSYDETTKSVDVVETRWAYFDSIYPTFSIRYYMVDWYNRSSFDSYYRYTNNFLKGILPVANNMYEPSKSTYTPSSTKLFRGDDGIFNKNELISWFITASSSLRLMNPSLDKFVATVPPGWFADYTTTKSALGYSHPNLESLIVAEARTFNNPIGLSTTAHELGHTFELWATGKCEEYESQCNPEAKDNIGNYAATGIFVNERIPIEIKGGRKVYCFMGSYNPDDIGELEYWIDSIDYGEILNLGKQNSINLIEKKTINRAILVSGLIGIDDAVSLNNWYILEEAELSHISPGTYNFEYLDKNNNLLHSISFDPVFTVMGIDYESSPFVFTIPNIDDTDKISITHNGSKLAEKAISPNSPIVVLESPNGGEVISGKAMISWNGSDVDLDELSYSVLVSPDNGITWEIIAFDIQQTEFTWDPHGFPPSSKYLIKVIATDGINTGQDYSDNKFSVLGRMFLPITMK